MLQERLRPRRVRAYLLVHDLRRVLHVVRVCAQREVKQPLRHGGDTPGHLHVRLQEDEEPLHHHHEIDDVTHHAPQNLQSISAPSLIRLGYK